MKVSVIICTYNRFEHLKKAIQSIIDQTYKDWEIIVVEGGGDDNSHRMLMSMYEKNAIKYVNNFLGSRIEARNIGLSVAEGEYVCFLDDDDTCIRNRFEQQINFLDNNADVDVVSCTTLFNQHSGLMHTLKPLNHVDITDLLYAPLDIDHVCHFQSCMFRRSSIEKCFDKGKYFYNEFIEGGEGQAMLYTMYFNGYKFANITDTIYIYNLGKLENSVSNNYTPRYYNQNLLEKDMHTKRNIIMELYNKLKGLFVEKQECNNNEVITETTEENKNVVENINIVEEKPKKVRKPKKNVEEVATEAPKKKTTRKKKEVTEEVATEAPKKKTTRKKKAE
jgi:glycosyltransferase involved in cell wall biosynthesis